MIKTFNTIDQCVDYLVRCGCEWNYDKELQLKTKYSYIYIDVMVIYDPFEITG